MREVTAPGARARAGEDRARRSRASRSAPPRFVVARDSEEEIAEGVQFVKQQIAFYGSTPAYRPVLELHGWGDLQEELNAMTKRGDWEQHRRADRRRGPAHVRRHRHARGGARGDPAPLWRHRHAHHAQPPAGARRAALGGAVRLVAPRRGDVSSPARPASSAPLPRGRRRPSAGRPAPDGPRRARLRPVLRSARGPV